MNTFIDIKEKIYSISKGELELKEKYIYLPSKNEFIVIKKVIYTNIPNKNRDIFFHFE